MSAQTGSIAAARVAAAPQNTSASAGPNEKRVFGPADKTVPNNVKPGPPQRPLVRRPTPMGLKIPPGLLSKGQHSSSPKAVLEEEEES